MKIFENSIRLKISAVGFAVFAYLCICAPSVHAASFTVATGNDENIDNSSCSLSEAIENINDASNTNTDCSPVGSYGTDDTITLATGTITLTADLPVIINPITIEGQGMGQSIVDGDSGQYQTFDAYIDPTTTITFQDMTITGSLINNTAGILVRTGNTEINRVEVDGHNVLSGSGPGTSTVGVAVFNKSTTPSTVHINNVYVHDLSSGANGVYGILVSTGDDGADTSEDMNVLIENSTVEKVDSSSAQGNAFGIFVGEGVNVAANGPGAMTAIVRNNTVTDMQSSNSSVVGLGTQVIGVTSQTPPLQASFINNTVGNLTGVDSGFGISSVGILALSGSFPNDLTNNIDMSFSNNFVFGTSLNCAPIEVSGLFGSNSTTNFSFTSSGGNLSDDNTCSTYFNQSTDQNNVSGLGSTLSALAENGGYVPTMALKQGSPAIDSGVTISGLNTDARGVSRPQGTAYDSGAYESPYSRATEDSNVENDDANLASTGTGVLQLVILAVSTVLFAATVVIWRIRQIA